METSLLQPVIVMMRKDFAVMRKDFAEPRDLYKTYGTVSVLECIIDFFLKCWTTRHDKISLFFFKRVFFFFMFFFGGGVLKKCSFTSKICNIFFAPQRHATFANLLMACSSSPDFSNVRQYTMIFTTILVIF